MRSICREMHVGTHRPQAAQEAPEGERPRGTGAEHAQEVRERLEHLADAKAAGGPWRRPSRPDESDTRIHVARVEIDVIPLSQSLVEAAEQLQTACDGTFLCATSSSRKPNGGAILRRRRRFDAVGEGGNDARFEPAAFEPMPFVRMVAAIVEMQRRGIGQRHQLVAGRLAPARPPARDGMLSTMNTASGIRSASTARTGAAARFQVCSWAIISSSFV